MNLDCIASTLIDAGLATQLGVDIYEHHIPFDAVEGILLKLPMNGIPINHYLPGYFHAHVQVIYRSKDQAKGEQMANAINQTMTLYKKTYKDTNGNVLMYIQQSLPQVLPIHYPRSKGNEYEWSCNFTVIYTMVN